jgi:hypothetical protein
MSIRNGALVEPLAVMAKVARQVAAINNHGMGRGGSIAGAAAFSVDI